MGGRLVVAASLEKVLQWEENVLGRIKRSWSVEDTANFACKSMGPFGPVVRFFVEQQVYTCRHKISHTCIKDLEISWQIHFFFF